jgi:hypothetical protein
MRPGAVGKAIRSIADVPGSSIESGVCGGRWWIAIHMPKGWEGHDSPRGWGSGETLIAACRVALWRLYVCAIGAEPVGPELSAEELADLIWICTPGPRS